MQGDRKMFTADNVEGFVYRAWEDVDVCRDCIAKINGCVLSVNECELANAFAHAMKDFCLKQNPAYQSI
jgi:hypothetical protein